MITIQKMDELDIRLVREIDNIWVDAFGYDPIENDEDLEIDAEWTMALLLDDDTMEVLAATALSNETIQFNGKEVTITGIISMASRYENKGNGKRLLVAIKEHLVSSNQTCVGFCKRKVTPFYEKCGFVVSRGLVEKFREKVDNALHPHPEGDEDVIFYNDTQGLQSILENDLNGFAVVDEFW